MSMKIFTGVVILAFAGVGIAMFNQVHWAGYNQLVASAQAADTATTADDATATSDDETPTFVYIKGMDGKFSCVGHGLGYPQVQDGFTLIDMVDPATGESAQQQFGDNINVMTYELAVSQVSVACPPLKVDQANRDDSDDKGAHADKTADVHQISSTVPAHSSSAVHDSQHPAGVHSAGSAGVRSTVLNTHH